MIFEGIWLLLCKSPVRQSWCNYRSRKVSGQTAYHTYIRNQLCDLEAALLDTLAYHRQHPHC